MQLTSQGQHFGYFIAQKRDGKNPGKAVGNDDGAIMLFEDPDKVKEVARSLSAELGEDLGVYCVSVSLVGEVSGG